MSFVNVISAIGNNNSAYPLFVRDCCIENPAKVVLTYRQNLKESNQIANDALRERTIDEYCTSAIWLGGIPLMDKLCKKVIKKIGYNPDIDLKLFKDNAGQGLKYNLDKFKTTAPNAVKDLEKILANKATYQKLQLGRFAISTIVPIALMGFVLPKLNFGLTKKLRNKKQNLKSPNVSFKGAAEILAGMPTVQRMAITDGGLTVGRVYTARNKNEKMEMGFKMGAMMYLNYLFPKTLAKTLDAISQKIFKLNVNLDPKLLNDKEFINSIKNNLLNLPKEDIIQFLDKKPNSNFAKLCEKYCDVKYLKDRTRDPRVFIDKEKINNFAKEIGDFANGAIKSGNVDKYAKTALKAKSFNIIANVCISSFLLAAMLPKVTFMLRKIITGKEPEPGLV